MHSRDLPPKTTLSSSSAKQRNGLVGKAARAAGLFDSEGSPNDIDPDSDGNVTSPVEEGTSDTDSNSTPGALDPELVTKEHKAAELLDLDDAYASGGKTMPSSRDYMDWGTHALADPEAGLRAAFFSCTYAAPALAILCAFYWEGPPAWWQFVLSFTGIFSVTGLCMSVCLHRYFAHQAFKTSRFFQAVLACMGCCAFQGSPVWWASKHRRHHKHCDTPEDPHSVMQTNFKYAFFGWTMAPREQKIDAEYVRRLNSFPELRVIGELWFVPPLLIMWAAYRAFGYYNMCLYSVVPMFGSRMVTLLFNVEYHPAQPANKKCQSVDYARFLADCVGESCHDHHHEYPQSIKRPSAGAPWLDLPFWIMCKPLLMLGVIWEPKGLNAPGLEGRTMYKGAQDASSETT